MPDIRKRANGSYQVRYLHNGKYRYRSFKRRKDAVTFVGTATVEVGAGTHVHDRDSITVAEAIDVWIAACKRGRKGREPVEAHTLRAYENHGRHIMARLGTKRLNELNGPEMQRFANQLVDDFSRASAKKVLTSMKSVLNEAKAQGYLTTDPAGGISIVRSSRHRTSVEIPTKAEASALLRAADALATSNDKRHAKAWRRYRPFIYLMALGGLRPSELRGLCWPQIDMDAATVRVDRRADEKGNIGPPKSTAGVRTVAIAPLLVDILRAWRGGCPISPAHLVFPNGEGNVEALSNIYNRAWVPLCRRAGVVGPPRAPEALPPPRYNLYALRHFFASFQIAAGANPKELQVDMGHSSVQVTLDLYGHLFPDDGGRRAARAGAMVAELL